MSYALYGRGKYKKTNPEKKKKRGKLIPQCGRCHWVDEEDRCRVVLSPRHTWLYQGECLWRLKEEI